MSLFENGKRLIIAIDPGETCGVVTWDVDAGKFIELESLSYWDTLMKINEIHMNRKEERNANGTIKGVGFVVEDPSKNKPVFPMKDETEKFKNALERNNAELHDTTLRIFSRRAQNVGMNKQMAKFICDYIERKNFKITRVRPSKKKLNAEDFRVKTGILERTNQHVRDAALLIFPAA